MSKPYVDSRFLFTTELNRYNTISNTTGKFNIHLSKEVKERLFKFAVSLGSIIVNKIYEKIENSKTNNNTAPTDDKTPSQTQHYAFYTLEENNKENSDKSDDKTQNTNCKNGHWATINGNHVFIEDK